MSDENERRSAAERDAAVQSAFMTRFHALNPSERCNPTDVRNDLFASGMSTAEFDDSFAALMSKGTITGRISADGQIVDPQPSRTAWLEHEKHHHGVDLDAQRRRTLQILVDYGPRSDWSVIADVHWRTLQFLLEDLDNEHHIVVKHSKSGPVVTWVSPLAKPHSD